ncbi:MAG: peptide-methionine (S)-S-oxide reductase MsrA [Saprospiraceae bacterium]|nr:peptide-methionine (S)-S-oxide reductase MsrA [Saprospiraceae bacterium]
MKKRIQLFLSFVFLLSFTACSQAQKKGAASMAEQPAAASPVVAVNQEGLEKIVVAQGCFWCVEEIFEAVKGVKSVVSGYSGGTEKNPTYEEVGSGSTSHAEAVEITYNPAEVSYEQLLKVYFNSGDITQVNGQGPDHGRQYRSIIFYNNDEQKKQVEAYIKKLEASGKYPAGIAVEVTPFTKFYPAEDYHQDFVKLNPNQGYVRAVSVPRFKKAIQHFPELLK